MTEDRKNQILDSMRVLTLLFGFKDKKSYQMTFDKLILLDFYLKFPKTMTLTDNIHGRDFDFEELYSFYHTQPNRESYHQILRYLVGKGLIERELRAGTYVYLINDNGEAIIQNFNNPYCLGLIKQANYISKDIAKLNETKLRDDILEKANKNLGLAIN